MVVTVSIGGASVVGSFGAARASSPLATLASTGHVVAMVYDPGSGMTYAGSWSVNGTNSTVYAIGLTLSVQAIAVGAMGKSMEGLALSPSGGYVDTANQYSNTVSVISTSTERVVATLSRTASNSTNGSVGVSDPYGMVADPSTGTVYVTSSCGTCHTSYVYEVNGTYLEPNPVKINGSGGAIGYSAGTGDIYVGVSNSSGSSVVILNRTNGIVGTYSVSGTIGAWAYDPADGQMYASDPTGRQIDYIPGSNSGVGTIPLAGNSTGLAYVPPWKAMYVSEPSAKEVQYITPGATVASNLSIPRLSLPPQGLVYNPIGGTVYVTANNSGGSGVVYVLGGPRMTQVADTDPLSTPSPKALAVVTETARVLVADPTVTTGSVSVLPTANGALTSISTGFEMTAEVMAATSGSTMVAIGPASGQAWFANTSSNQPLPVNGRSPAISVSPLTEPEAEVSNGHGYVFVSCHGVGGVAAFDTTTSPPTRGIQVFGGTSHPTSIAYDGITNRVYVSDPGTNSVWELTDTVPTTNVSRILLTATPGSVLTSPITGDVYVAMMTLGTIEVYSGATYVQSIMLPGGSVPLEMETVGPYLYVTDLGVNMVSVINLQTNALVGSVRLGAKPMSMGSDPVTSEAYVGLNVSGTAGAVAVLSGTTLIKEIATGVEPTAEVYDPATGWMNVANNGSETITVIDPGSLVVVATIGDNIGVGPVALVSSEVSGEMYALEYGSRLVTPY